MDNNGTTLALAIGAFELAVVLLTFFVAWRHPDMPNRGFGVAVGAIMLILMLVMTVMAVFSPGDRRPMVFFLAFFGLIVGPGPVIVITQGLTGWQFDDHASLAEALKWLVPYLGLTAFGFLRLSTWASASPPDPGSVPISSSDLRQRLLMLNDQAFPFSVRSSKRANELVMDWKYADASWLSLMNANKMTQLARFIMRLDERDHTVRVMENRREFSASAGREGLRLSGHFAWGVITFYEYKQETIYGVQIENGRPVPRLSYTYRFDSEEMRQPLLLLTRENGWTFQPVPLFWKLLTG